MLFRISISALQTGAEACGYSVDPSSIIFQPRRLAVNNRCLPQGKADTVNIAHLLLAFQKSLNGGAAVQFVVQGLTPIPIV
jgi:hypothetical protein